jgi:hypothetical protein
MKQQAARCYTHILNKHDLQCHHHRLDTAQPQDPSILISRSTPERRAPASAETTRP